MANQISITGNVGKVELKQGPKGPVLSFSVAEWVRKDVTQWYNCAQFGKAAEDNAEKIKKGMGVTIFGRLETGAYARKDGTPAPDLKVFVNSVVRHSNAPAEKEADQTEMWHSA